MKIEFLKLSLRIMKKLLRKGGLVESEGEGGEGLN